MKHTPGDIYDDGHQPLVFSEDREVYQMPVIDEKSLWFTAGQVAGLENIRSWFSWSRFVRAAKGLRGRRRGFEQSSV